MEGLRGKSLRSLKRGFTQAIDVMKKVPYDRTHRKPQVLIVGEYLLNFHPGANHDVELYLERNGLEVIEACMTDVITEDVLLPARAGKGVPRHAPPQGEGVARHRGQRLRRRPQRVRQHRVRAPAL